MMFRLRSLLHFSVCLCLALTSGRLACAQERTLAEHQVKALFIFNFVQFVEWPASSFPTRETPVRIGILGDHPFEDALIAATKDEKVNGRPLQVIEGKSVEALKDCHVIFVSRSERARLEGILADLGSKPVLTVGDMPEFAQRGGILNFYRDGEKVRFEANRAAAQRANLKLSAQLVRLAKLVESSGGERR